MPLSIELVAQQQVYQERELDALKADTRRELAEIRVELKTIIEGVRTREEERHAQEKKLLYRGIIMLGTLVTALGGLFLKLKGIIP